MPDGYCMFADAEEGDAGSLVNSKVRAVRDYFTQKQGHLTFSKGQYPLLQLCDMCFPQTAFVSMML